MQPVRTALLAVLTLAVPVLPAHASTMAAIDRHESTWSLGTGGFHGVGGSLDLAVAPRWKVGAFVGNASLNRLFAYHGIRTTYAITEPGATLSSGFLFGVSGEQLGPDNLWNYVGPRVNVGMLWAYSLTPQLTLRLNLANLGDWLLLPWSPWYLLTAFYGQETGVHLGYRLNPSTEITLGANPTFNQILGLRIAF